MERLQINQLSTIGRLRLSFGHGTLYTNSLTGNAYATTETYSGNADYIYAYVGAGDNLTVYVGTSNSSKNASSVKTDTVNRSYESSRFAKSDHTITYNGETQTASNVDNY